MLLTAGGSLTVGCLVHKCVGHRQWLLVNATSVLSKGNPGVQILLSNVVLFKIGFRGILLPQLFKHSNLISNVTIL